MVETGAILRFTIPVPKSTYLDISSLKLDQEKINKIIELIQKTPPNPSSENKKYDWKTICLNTWMKVVTVYVVASQILTIVSVTKKMIRFAAFFTQPSTTKGFL